MQGIPLTSHDEQLIQAAQAIIARLYRPDQHHVGAALATQSGRIFTAVHLESYLGRTTVCAEAMVMGKAFSEGERDFATIVAVRHPDADDAQTHPYVVPPCGMCRELMLEYGPNMAVILPHKKELLKCQARDLLPFPYRQEG